MLAKQSSLCVSERAEGRLPPKTPPSQLLATLQPAVDSTVEVAEVLLLVVLLVVELLLLVLLLLVLVLLVLVSADAPDDSPEAPTSIEDR